MTELEPREKSGLSADILNPLEAGWNDKIDNLRQALGAPNNPFLFPPHFVKRTLISIGGSVIEFKDGNEILGAGFIFPRRGEYGIGYTLRFHCLSRDLQRTKTQSLTEDALCVKYGKPFPVYSYVPEENVYGDGSLVNIRDGLSIERTSGNTAREVRNLQREIWGVSNDDFLYPEDIHSPDFALPTSLIAYVDSRPVGFLFGFDKFCFEEIPAVLQKFIANPAIRQESQLMGVLPDQRSKSIATMLKIKQAEQAFQNGIEIINWTFDPLLSQNAVLNVNKLRGIIWEHHPNYYAFSGANKLNQVVASRFSVSWLIASPRVKYALGGREQGGYNSGIVERFNSGAIPIITSTREVEPIKGEKTRAIDEDYKHSIESSNIAIEIPVNWTTIQGNNLPLAQKWRDTTDNIFQEYIGTSDRQYAITDVVTIKKDGTLSKAFLIGQSIAQIDRIFLGEI